jgi:hypothetical protein
LEHPAAGPFTPREGRDALYPPATFAVFADTHYYDPGLGTAGPDFHEDLEREVKLIEHTPEILEQALKEVAALQVDFLLICGDLTREGEHSSHRLLQETLTAYSRRGLKILVINGNHDVNNSRARSYPGGRRCKVETLSGEGFARMYREQGYGQALYRDPNSLSYLAEPVPGLWLFCLDTCIWHRGEREEGRLSRSTLTWLRPLLDQGRREGKGLLAMMHHGLLEHYPGNLKFFRPYIIDNHREAAELLAGAGVRVVFSGHFHSQDIAFRDSGGQPPFIYDVETGSLATYPCPYRLVRLDASQRLQISTRRVTAIPSRPADFSAYAYHRCCQLAEGMVDRTLRGYGVPARDRALLAPQVVAAFRAHGLGNTETTAMPLDLAGVSPWGRFVMEKKRGLLEGLWQQSPPPDNELTIDLLTGAYT